MTIRYRQRRSWLPSLVATLIFLHVLPAFSGPLLLSESEFVEAAQKVAPKVNLFADVWSRHPDARFFGGTSRDFLFWLRLQLAQAKTREEALQIVARLEKRPSIDTREFIRGQSDVDIHIANGQLSIDGNKYGVSKIEVINSDRFDPNSAYGQDEKRQGYLPVEKVYIGRDEIKTLAGFGDGVGDAFRGNSKVVFPKLSEFDLTRFAKSGKNHPILIILRHFRLLSMNFRATHGPVDLRKAQLLAAIAPAERAFIEQIAKEALRTGDFKERLGNPALVIGINRALNRLFGPYTNPSASMALLEEFGLQKLPFLYPEIEPIRHLVFSKERDPLEAAKAIAEFKVNAEKFYTSAREEFPDAKLFHGTRTNTALRDILREGLIESTGGMAGPGLYGVRSGNREFAVEWGGGEERVLAIDLDPQGKVVDVTQGEGRRVWRAFVARHGDDYERFARIFDIDIIRYPYGTRAYVVKNGAVIKKITSPTQQIFDLSGLIEIATHARTLDDVGRLLKKSHLLDISQKEGEIIFDALQGNPSLVPLYQNLSFSDLVAKLASWQSGGFSSNQLLGVIARQLIANRANLTELNQRPDAELIVTLNQLKELRHPELLRPNCLKISDTKTRCATMVGWPGSSEALHPGRI